MKLFPRQRLSFNEKKKDDFKWAKDVVDSLLIQDTSNRTVLSTGDNDYDRMYSNYQLFNNQLNQKDYERECEPFGLEVGQYKDEVQPYNKTYNKIQKLLGDELLRPLNYKAVLTSAEGIKSKMSYHNYLLRQHALAKIQSAVQSVAPYFEQELVDNSAPIMDPEEISRYMNTTYSEAREIKANKLLRYFFKAYSIPELKNDAYKHALISGLEIAYIGLENNEPTLEIINPLGFFYHKSPETKYIQNGLYAGYRTYMTSGDILDRFGSHLTQEEIEKIDTSRHGGYRDASKDFPYYAGSQYLSEYSNAPHSEGSYSESSSIDDWLVQHVEWRSQREVGFLSYLNEYGDEEMDMVSEDFEVPSYATKSTVESAYNKKVTTYNWTGADGTPFSLHWSWIPEVWNAVRIGDNIYTMIGPKEVQFRSSSNPFHVKLGYHGLIYNAMNASPISLMDRMKPFQYLFFVIMHKLKRLIAHDKGKIFHLDSTMVDPKIGWEKTIYYLTQMNLDIYNPLQNADQPGGFQRGKVSGSTDMSLAQNIANYVELLNAIDQQISDVAGVNRQAEGQISPTEAVTNAQSNVAMSSVLMEPYAFAHDKNWEQILSSFLQASQSAYKGKHIVKQTILDDLSVATLEINPDELTDVDLGIFISNSAKDELSLQKLEALAQSAMQNDKAKLSDMVKMFNASSSKELEKFIIESEKKAEQSIQAQIQQQQQAEMEMQQSAQEFELEKLQRELDNKVMIAEINSFARQMDQDVNDNNIPDQFEIEKFKAELSLKDRKLKLEEKKLKVQAEQKDKELEIKKRQANRPAAK